MAFKGLSPSHSANLLQRPLGSHEVQVRNCHSKHKSAMNILSGLTLVTRHQIDEGKLHISNFYISHCKVGYYWVMTLVWACHLWPFLLIFAPPT